MIQSSNEPQCDPEKGCLGLLRELTLTGNVGQQRHQSDYYYCGTEGFREAMLPESLFVHHPKTLLTP